MIVSSATSLENFEQYSEQYLSRLKTLASNTLLLELLLLNDSGIKRKIKKAVEL